jgi:uncharacterized protein (DUF1810 family)
MQAADLDRFVRAQSTTYVQALAELRAGHKTGHWIWFILPQLRGLGHSPTSEQYGISNREEARAYLAHPELGPRLVECVQAMLNLAGTTAADVLGEVDALKFRSCLTLFEAVADEAQRGLFTRALAQFYAGHGDPATAALLARADRQG